MNAKFMEVLKLMKHVIISKSQYLNLQKFKFSKWEFSFISVHL